MMTKLHTNDFNIASASGRDPLEITGCVQTISVSIELGARSYSILIGEHLLSSASTWEGLPEGNYALIVTNDTVAPLYAGTLQTALKNRYTQVNVLSLPDGERYKTFETLNTIFTQLLSTGADRRTVLFALGGGVVGDMTGFAAACFMRGVAYVQVATTLLAQVDSSVGGKTAINHPLGKNMIGAFYQPQLVVCDLDTLQSLPPRELRAGLAEIIKYGPIADIAFFQWIEEHLQELLAKDKKALAYAVQRSCEIKAAVVGADEREGGLRAILNYGHTFGHAIEAGLGFGEWLHGEAVGCGMVMAAHLSLRLGLLERAFVDRLTDLIAQAGLPVKGPRLGVQTYLEHMRVDKKSQNGQIRFVVINTPGHAEVMSAPDALVCDVIEACCEPEINSV